MIRNKKRGFSLLEIIVSITISASLVSIGLVGLNKFKNFSQFQSVYQNLISSIKTIKNNARDSVLSHDSVSGTNVQIPFIYSIFLDSNSNSYSFANCYNGANVNGKGICNVDTTIKAVSLKTQNTNIVSKDPNCYGFGFVRLPGFTTVTDPIVAIDANGNYTYTNISVPSGKCIYSLVSSDGSYTDLISVNLKNGLIDYNAQDIIK